jgi:Acetyltransferase (GNAT) family
LRFDRFNRPAQTPRERIVGWCDMVPGKAPSGFGHVGRLGMAVPREWRRQGLGRELLARCLREVPRAGLEKVELEVYIENQAALRLYRSFGFMEEGLKRRARKLEGRYQDIVLMALHLERGVLAGRSLDTRSFGPHSDVMADSSAALQQLDDRIAVVRDNIRELIEQAAAYSGASDDQLISQRIAEQEALLAELTKKRDALAGSTRS